MSLRVSHPLRSTSTHPLPNRSRLYPVFGARPFTLSSIAVASAVCGAAVDAADCTSTSAASTGAGRTAACSWREGSVGVGVGVGAGCAVGETFDAEDVGGDAEDVGGDAAGAFASMGPAAADPAMIMTRPPARIPAPARRVFLPSHELRRMTAHRPVAKKYRPAPINTPLNPVVKPTKATRPNAVSPEIFPGPIDLRGALAGTSG